MATRMGLKPEHRDCCAGLRLRATDLSRVVDRVSSFSVKI